LKDCSVCLPLTVYTLSFMLCHVVGIRATITNQYADQLRAEMLSRIVELELVMKEKENTITSLCKEFDENKEQYEERINSKL